MGTKNQSKPAIKKIFEPITSDQITKIHARTAEIGLSEDDLYAMIEQVTGFASISAMSRQEAAYIIDRLQGPTKWLRPLPPQTEDEIWGDASDLPYLGHIIGIRVIAKELGWGKGHLKNWLRKYLKVQSIRKLNRQKAAHAFVAIQKVQRYRKIKGAA